MLCSESQSKNALSEVIAPKCLKDCFRWAQDIGPIVQWLLPPMWFQLWADAQLSSSRTIFRNTGLLYWFTNSLYISTGLPFPEYALCFLSKEMHFCYFWIILASGVWDLLGGYPKASPGTTGLRRAGLHLFVCCLSSSTRKKHYQSTQASLQNEPHFPNVLCSQT